jgi:hypothetical protein
MYVSRPRRTMSANAPRQFSLRSLMLFVAVCAVYFSQFALTLAVGGRVTSWRGVVTIGFAWLVLAAFYLRQRLSTVLFIHCLVPTVPAVLALLIDPTSAERWQASAAALLVFSFFVNVLCFPFGVMTMAVRWCRRPAAHEENTTRD